MRKFFALIIPLFLLLLISGCSKEEKKDTDRNKNEKTEEVDGDTKPEKKYWVNSNSNVIHNRTCRWYNNTKKGYFTDKCEGRNCGICGGCR